MLVGELEPAGAPLSPDEPVTELDVAHGPLVGTTVEAAEVPLAIDELPLVALLGCFAEGETVVRGAEELRVKETDRIATVVDGLRGLGAEIEATADGFVVQGTGGLRGGTIASHGDHRLAMLGAVAGLASREGVEVDGMEAAAVSYPGFERDLAALPAASLPAVRPVDVRRAGLGPVDGAPRRGELPAAASRARPASAPGLRASSRPPKSIQASVPSRSTVACDTSPARVDRPAGARVDEARVVTPNASSQRSPTIRGGTDRERERRRPADTAGEPLVAGLVDPDRTGGHDRAAAGRRARPPRRCSRTGSSAVASPPRTPSSVAERAWPPSVQ